MLLRLRVAFRKELTQFFRSKPLVFLVLYMFAEVANCAWALSLDVRNLPLLVVDRDQTSASRALTERFRVAPYFDYRRAEGPVDPEAFAPFRELRRSADSLDEAGARELLRAYRADGGDLKALRLALTARERGPELWSILLALPRDEALRRTGG